MRTPGKAPRHTCSAFVAPSGPVAYVQESGPSWAAWGCEVHVVLQSVCCLGPCFLCQNGVKLRPSAPAVKERTQGAAFEGRRLLDKLLSTKVLDCARLACAVICDVH